MLFPYADDNPTERTPLVTIGIIGMNVLVFLAQAASPVLEPASRLEVPHGVVAFGAVPSAIASGTGAGAVPPWATLLTCLFVHAGFAHLLSNMWFLWIFGNNVEDRMGRWRFTFFYLACGVVATLAHVVAEPRSDVPLVGASGAISGVLAAYIVLFPTARVRAFLFVVFFVTVVSLPAWVFLGINFVTNLFLGMDALRARATDQGGVAYLAHLGGYAAGFCGVFLLTSPRDWFRGSREVA